MFAHSATALRSLAGLAWGPFGWRFGRSGKGRSGKGKEERARKWRGKEDPGVEFPLEGRLVLTRPFARSRCARSQVQCWIGNGGEWDIGFKDGQEALGLD